jgi:hypothetical protein
MNAFKTFKKFKTLKPPPYILPRVAGEEQRACPGLDPGWGLERLERVEPWVEQLERFERTAKWRVWHET